MTEKELLKIFKKPIGKKDVLSLAHQYSEFPDFTRHLIELSFHSEQEVAFRSAWVLEYCMMLYPKAMTDHLDYFLEAYPKQNNLSCKRHFTKLMMSLSEPGNHKLLHQCNLNPVIETTFEWLINPGTPVAVQVNCLDILFNLRSHGDWIEGELNAQIEFLLKDGTAAMQSRGKRVLKQLNSIK
ncbi:hypothetical protein ACFSJU_13945 [Paradesertivirga mongoliensis]|uniref:Adenylosuccinate lyase n=1 Tax=Paradesertivirga mongoliensis TaxID=2100740 RepID=A0ABW4ZNT3_9SPHI|nr:hypothetical protein [Pedobacter mongoliensis]